MITLTNFKTLSKKLKNEVFLTYHFSFFCIKLTNWISCKNLFGVVSVFFVLFGRLCTNAYLM